MAVRMVCAARERRRLVRVLEHSDANDAECRCSIIVPHSLTQMREGMLMRV